MAVWLRMAMIDQGIREIGLNHHSNRDPPPPHRAVVVVSRCLHVARANAEIGQRRRGFLARKVADKIIIAKVFFWNGSTTTVYYVFVFHSSLLLFIIIVTFIVFSTLK